MAMARIALRVTLLATMLLPFAASAQVGSPQSIKQFTQSASPRKDKETSFRLLNIIVTHFFGDNATKFVQISITTGPVPADIMIDGVVVGKANASTYNVSSNSLDRVEVFANGKSRKINQCNVVTSGGTGNRLNYNCNMNSKTP
jgi:hypothetical protein